MLKSVRKLEPIHLKYEGDALKVRCVAKRSKQYISYMESIRNSVAGIANQILVGLDERGRVEVAWPLAAGYTVAKRTRTLLFAAGKLAIAVPDKAWQQQLAALRPQLRAHLTRLTGVAVADILFLVETKGD